MSASYLVIGTIFEGPRFVYTWGLVPPMPPLQTNCNLLLSCIGNIIHLLRASFKKELKCRLPCYFCGLPPAADRQRDYFSFYIQSKYMYAFHRHIVNAIKEDIKLTKEPYFSFLYKFQDFRAKVLFGLFVQTSRSRPNRLFAASLFIPAPKDWKASKAIAKHAGVGGRGASRFYPCFHKKY